MSNNPLQKYMIFNSSSKYFFVILKKYPMTCPRRILSFPKNNGIMFNSRFDIAYEIENG